MIDLDDLKPLPTRYGSLQGRSKESRVIDRLGGQDTIRKEIRENSDGGETQVHTRGPRTQPKIMTDEYERTFPELVIPPRTFVFNTLFSPIGVVANYHETVTKSQPVGRSSYFVAPYRTSVDGYKHPIWNDVFRIDVNWRDETNVKFFINGFEKAQYDMPDFGPSAIPFCFLQDGMYSSTLSADPTRASVFVAQSYSVSRVSSLNADGTEKEYMAASGSGTGYTALCGLRVSDDGKFYFGNVAVYPGPVDVDTLAGMDVYWTIIRALKVSPYLELVGTGLTSITFGSIQGMAAEPTTFSGEFTAGIDSIPALYLGRTRDLVSQTNDDFNTLEIGVDWSNWIWTTQKSDPLVTTNYVANAENSLSGTVVSGGGIELKTTYKTSGAYKSTDVPSGSIYVTEDFTGSGYLNWETGAPVTGVFSRTVYSGYRRDTTSEAESDLKVSISNYGLPEKNILEVTTFVNATTEVRYELESYSFDPGVYGSNTPEIPNSDEYKYIYSSPAVEETFEIEDWKGWTNATYCNGSNYTLCIASYPTYTYTTALNYISPKIPVYTELHSARVMNYDRAYTSEGASAGASFRTVDYIYADVDEEVYIYLVTSSSYNLVSTSVGGTPAESQSLSATLVFNSRFGNTSVSIPVSGLEHFFLDLLPNFVYGDGSKYHLNGYIGKFHANYIPPQVFAPVFMEQGNCPWVSYTTKAEEATGVLPEIHVDFTVKFEKYSTHEYWRTTRYSGTVGFVPHQFLHVHQRYMKHRRGFTDYNLGLWDLMFSNPFRIQFSNVGGNPYEFSEDIKLQHSRI